MVLVCCRDLEKLFIPIVVPTTELTLEALADLQCPGAVRLAPSEKYVIYFLRPASRPGEHEISSLWIAKLEKSTQHGN